MINESTRRQLKGRLSDVTNRISIQRIVVGLSIVSTILFCVVQLAVNADLNPKGVLLESLNREKTALVEENRQLEQEIAKAESLSIISDIAKNKLKLTDYSNGNTFYVSDSSIVSSVTTQ